MLSLMRKQAGTWMIKVVLGAIVVVFAFWGVGSYTERKSNQVAAVNGEMITQSEYQKVYNTLLERMQQQFGNALNEEMLEMLQLKSQAVNQLVDTKVLVQEAKKLNFTVSDEELSTAIKNIAAFQTDGRFDNRRYEFLLNNNRMTPEEFEIVQREVMLIGKLRNFVTESAKVSDAEVREWFDWINTACKIDFAVFEPSRYTDIKPSAEDTEKYYQDQKDSFRTEPMVRLRYVKFDTNAYMEQGEIGDDVVREFYEENLGNYQVVESVEARHILFRVEEGAAPEIEEEARKKAAEISQKAQDGEDFAELAKTFSEGPTAGAGGYLGKLTRNRMVKPFEEKAFSMSAGEISEPVRTPFGWHIIKVEKVNPARVRALEEVSAEIRTMLKQSEASTFAADSAEDFFDSVFEPVDFSLTAKEKGIPIVEATITTAGTDETGIEVLPAELAKSVFELQEEDISEIQEIGDAYYIVHLQEKIPGAIPEFSVVSAEVTEKLAAERREEHARELAVVFLQSLEGGNSFDSESEKAGIKVNTSGDFKRNEAIPDIGNAPPVAKAAFELKNIGDVAKEVLNGPQGYYVVRLAGRVLPEGSEFEKQKEALGRQLLEQKKTKLFQEWLVNARDNSEILVEKEFSRDSI